MSNSISSPPMVGLRKYILYYNVVFPACDTFVAHYTLCLTLAEHCRLAFDGNAVIAELWGASLTPVLLGMEPNSYCVLLLIQLSPYGLYQITHQSQVGFAGKRLSLADIDSELFRLLVEAFVISKTATDLVNTCERILYKRMEKQVVSGSLLLASKVISDNYGQIQVKEVARQSHYSERHLNRLISGVSPQKYLKTLSDFYYDGTEIYNTIFSKEDNYELGAVDRLLQNK